MAEQQIKAQITKCPDTVGKDKDERPNPAIERVGTTYECTVNFPANMDEAMAEWGSEVCYNRVMGAVVIDCQSMMRTHIKSEEFSEASLQNLVTGFAPQLKKSGVSFQTKVDDYVSNLDEDSLAALLERVKKQQAEQAA